MRREGLGLKEGITDRKVQEIKVMAGRNVCMCIDTYIYIYTYIHEVRVDC